MDSSFAAPKILIPDPSLESDLTLAPEVNTKKSSRDTPLPILATPYTVNVLPILNVLLTDSEDDKLTLSRTDNMDANLDTPYTDKLEPHRKIARRDAELDSTTESSVDKLLPYLSNPYNEAALPWREI
jgi:hypothetical protein